MTVISTNPDRENLTLTVVAEFDASADRVWDIWADPRKLEKWWGPPTWPASFPEHDFREGGEAKYFMTGPEGEKAGGYWRFEVIKENERIELLDGFADENGVPNEEMPSMKMAMSLEENDGKTTMTTVTSFNSVDELDQLIEMGMLEGMKAAMGQIDGLL